MVYEIVIIFLLAIICFLLYKLYRIKYEEGGGSELIPKGWKKDLMELDSEKGKEFEMRFEDINSRISEIEKRIERYERIVKKLVEELS